MAVLGVTSLENLRFRHLQIYNSRLAKHIFWPKRKESLELEGVFALKSRKYTIRSL